MVEKVNEKNNGLSEDEIKIDFEKSVDELSKKYGAKISESEDLEKEIDQIYDHIFNIDSNVSKKNSDNSRDELRNELKKIVDSYKLSDYATLDVNINENDASAKKVIDTSFFEKVLHRLSSLDSSLKKNFESKLEKKYMAFDSSEKMELIVEQNQIIIDKCLQKYSEVENNIKSFYKDIVIDRRESQKKLNLCNNLIKNSSELIENYNLQLDKIKNDLDKAYNLSNSGAIIDNLENDQNEIILKLEENKAKMVQTYKVMKKLDLQVDSLLNREINLRTYNERINQKIKDLQLFKDFLDVTKKQYDISTRLSSIEVEGSSLDSYIGGTSNLIKDIDGFNRVVDDSFEKMNSTFSAEVDKMLIDNNYSKNKYKQGEDIEKVKMDAEKIMANRRKKDFDRISYIR